MKGTTLNINYWKEIDKNIDDVLRNLNGIVLLLHNSVEFLHIIDFLNKVKPDHFTNVLYISLIRSYNYMRHVLDINPLEEKRLFFIDCVSGFAFPPEENIDDCLYHKPPQDLERMKEIIKFGIEKSNPDIVIIDSLSQFINFSRPTEDELLDLYEFLKSLKENSLNILQDTFILLYDSKMGVAQNLPKTFTDMILRLEVAKE